MIMRVYNFAAGPATLPLPVLLRAQAELVEHGGNGMSVMEMTHRSPMFKSIIDGAEASLRRLMDIPEDYAVLFLQGGATTQFSAVPMNLMHTGKADYIVSGNFAAKAAKEGEKYGAVRVVKSSKDKGYAYVPKTARSDFDPSADYVHITTNNTIYGTSYRTNLPDCGDVPLVADMSSNILSEPYDVRRFGLIYAGAQKNIGPAGVTIVIVRKDLAEKGPIADFVPSLLRYDIQVKDGSMHNTPPTFAIYLAGLVFEELEKTGGIAAAKERNEAKAKLLYDVLDASSFYRPVADKEDRSIMNITFTTPDPDTDARFVKEAAARGLVNLKGHRAAGGIRASIYNAMTIEGVRALCDFMRDFEKNA
jgi:phosphoserine aminotransferase